MLYNVIKGILSVAMFVVVFGGIFPHMLKQLFLESKEERTVEIK